MTSVGDIDVELWSKEAPKACRNFVQLCLEGYYNGTVFHRLVRDFIVQGGDPTGTGHGGESVYGKPFNVSLQFFLHYLLFKVYKLMTAFITRFLSATEKMMFSVLSVLYLCVLYSCIVISGKSTILYLLNMTNKILLVNITLVLYFLQYH